jgi:hypothetical protein
MTEFVLRRGISHTWKLIHSLRVTCVCQHSLHCDVVTLQLLKLNFNARLTLPSRYLIASEGIKQSILFKTRPCSLTKKKSTLSTAVTPQPPSASTTFSGKQNTPQSLRSISRTSFVVPQYLVSRSKQCPTFNTLSSSSGQ